MDEQENRSDLRWGALMHCPEQPLKRAHPLFLQFEQMASSPTSLFDLPILSNRDSTSPELHLD